jgi:DNA-binding CsgD family transcriptional regulator
VLYGTCARGADLAPADVRASLVAIAPRTAQAHAENIRRKLDVRSRAQIARWVTEYRLRTRR